MNESESAQKQAPAADDLLPPVEPPSAGFIIQLFVVPALIVLVIVGVWLLFTTLVRHSSPEKVLQGLEHGPTIARWQRASELADMLRNERFAEFKRSSEAAQHVARILDREIDSAIASRGVSEEDVTLRYFLARALGEFEVAEGGVDVLLEAAETQRHPREQLVRQGALEALAVRAFNLRKLDPPRHLEHPQLVPTLAKLAGDESPQIRYRAAYVLGQIGTPAAIERLEPMVDDPDAETRYNAALALAHHGNARAVETLAEMLDPEEFAGTRGEPEEQGVSIEHSVIVASAIQAAQELAQKNPRADLTPVLQSLKRLAAADDRTLQRAQLPHRAALDAQQALQAIQSR